MILLRAGWLVRNISITWFKTCRSIVILNSGEFEREQRTGGGGVACYMRNG